MDGAIVICSFYSPLGPNRVLCTLYITQWTQLQQMLCVEIMKIRVSWWSTFQNCWIATLNVTWLCKCQFKFKNTFTIMNIWKRKRTMKKTIDESDWHQNSNSSESIKSAIETDTSLACHKCWTFQQTNEPTSRRKSFIFIN